MKAANLFFCSSNQQVFLSFFAGRDETTLGKPAVDPSKMPADGELNGSCEKAEPFTAKSHQSLPKISQDSRARLPPPQDSNNKLTRLNENGLSEKSGEPAGKQNHLMAGDPTQASVTGSNGYVLNRQPTQEPAPYRTSGTTVGASLIGHAAKTLPGRSLNAVKTDGARGQGPALLREEKDKAEGITKHAAQEANPPAKIHRARKTMARPLVNQTTLKVSLLSFFFCLQKCLDENLSSQPPSPIECLSCCCCDYAVFCMDASLPLHFIRLYFG